MSIQSSEQLQDLLAEWFERIHSGDVPDLREHCSAHPELEARLRKLIEREARFTGTPRRPLRADAEDMLTQTPGMLGRFRLRGLLGSGGMGRVFRAIDEHNGEEVALKLLQPSVWGDRSARLRFVREAEIARELAHPNIVPILETGRIADATYIAMQLLGGPTLHDWGGSKEATPSAVAAVGASIARALHEAHGAGVVHRDVKPANIMFDQGIPYILDFGLARALGDQKVTCEGFAPGTLSYMAPEQLDGRVFLDPRLDVYSLGATLFEALCGSAPFEGTPEALIRRILLHDPPPLGLSGRDRDLETIIHRAMEKNPAKRFQSALEMAEECERFLEAKPILSKAPGRGERGLRWVRRHRLAALSLGVSLILAISLSVLLIESRRTESQRLHSTLSQVESLLTAGEPKRAEELIAKLPDLGADATRISQLREDAAAQDALQSLLGQLLSRSETQDLEALERRASVLRMGRSHFTRSPLSRLALCVLDILRGFPRSAGHRIESIEGLPRTTAAFGALCARTDLEAALGKAAHLPSTAPDPRRADDHVFAALAIRMGGGSTRSQSAELDRARRIMPSHQRTIYATGMLLEEMRRYEEARWVFRQLKPQPSQAPAVWAARSRIATYRGRYEEARRLLMLGAQATQQLGAREAYAPLTLAKLELMARTSDSAEALDLAQRSAKRWPSHPHLRMMLGYLHAQRGELDLARQSFRAARALQPLATDHRKAERALLQADLAGHSWSAELDPVPAMPPKERAALQELVGRSDELIRQAKASNDALTLSEALLVRSRCHRAAGRRKEAWNDLLRAIRAEPTPAALTRYALRIASRLYSVEMGDPDRDELPLGFRARDHIQLALQRAESVAQHSGRGALPPSPGQRQEAQLARTLIFDVLRDEKGAVRCARATLALITKRGVRKQTPKELISYLESLASE